EGNQTRSFCYVSDTVDAFVRLMATPDDFTGPVNIGNPHECTVRELAEKIVSLTGSASPIVSAPLPSDDPCRRCPDIGLARSGLGWQPRVALEEGLLKTIEYFDRLLGERDAEPEHPRQAPEHRDRRNGDRRRDHLKYVPWGVGRAA